jgi:large subunit ribosomal protein L1
MKKKQPSKRLKMAKKKIEDKCYTPQDAIKLLKEVATAKFIETAEAHICLNVNPKYADQQVRATVVLPAGTGKQLKVAALVANDQSPEYKNTSADIIGSDNFIEEINKGVINFDLLIAEPEMMPKLAKLGRVLGPKGLMPSPKSGTVTKDIKATVQEFKKGKLEYKVDKTGILHINFGKLNFSNEDLLENLRVLYKSVLSNKPSGVKGKYFKKFYICSTMGPSIEIDFSLF